MFLVAGLGNPEKKYDNTRHNIGFEAIKLFSANNNITLNKNKFKAIIGEGYVGSEKVIIALPQTYMNLSGESIGEIAFFYKIPNENIIIAHDDISMDIGRIRIREKGSAGGHNGLKSIISHLGSDVFCRIKIGVGAPKHEDYDLADFVLGSFTKDEQKILEPVLKDVSSAIECIIKDSASKAMNKYNR
ncbi:MAG: aminoacyl-tRNA hydrolase [Clostridia bacterium]|nr:aminoacyl-tRNA hydrolase [Clostridia bacterium]MBO7288424.1 aminoacyl-tRNA hydrolase [Clostridia bacterium]